MALAQNPHHSHWWGFFVVLPAEPHRQRTWLWRSTAELGSFVSNRAATVEFIVTLARGYTLLRPHQQPLPRSCAEALRVMESRL
jgi:hypothetical protein